jgi:hypothetical protein
VSNKIFSFQAFYNATPKYINYLKVFGEMGVIRYHDAKFQSKLKDKRATVMFLGYEAMFSGPQNSKQ